MTGLPPVPGEDGDRLVRGVRRARARRRSGRVPGLSRYLAQVGILGWMIVVPTLIGVVVGRWLDRRLASGVFWSASLLFLGAAFGGWSIWRWMSRRGQ